MIHAAEAYDNEESVGLAIEESGIKREDIFLTTKIGAGLKNGPVIDTLKQQLVKLRTSYVDLYLIHWPTDLGKDGFPDAVEAWQGMEACKDAGLAKVSLCVK